MKPWTSMECLWPPAQVPLAPIGLPLAEAPRQCRTVANYAFLLFPEPTWFEPPPGLTPLPLMSSNRKAELNKNGSALSPPFSREQLSDAHPPPNVCTLGLRDL